MSRQLALLVAFRVAFVLCAAPAVAAPGDPPPYDAPGWLPEDMIAWASDWEEIVRGPMEIGDPQSDPASFGTVGRALGPATGDELDVVSLGDGGHVTLLFDAGIRDGPGDDFAVFENGFFSPNGFFAELAFVEVSSNGVDFARFEPTSLQEDPVPDGGVVDWRDFDNLGGKHPLGEGTGFDLAELAGHALVTAELLDLQDVGWVRIVDVIGDGSTLDHAGAPVYDPYPTPYLSGGHDLEAIGVRNAPEPGAGAALAPGALLVAALARRRRRA